MKTRLLLLFLLLPFAAACLAEPVDLPGRWFDAGSGWVYQGSLSPDQARLAPVPGVSLTGGRFVFQSDFEVAKDGRYVIDFKNTSIIAHFRHVILDAQQQPVATFEGGIESRSGNDFTLRHGRELALAAGQYRLVSELESPFFLAPVELYLNELAAYRSSIKTGNALTLIGFGVFLGLGIYYAALSLARTSRAESMYAVFILGNLLFNACALLVLSDVFGIHWIYAASVPILISNMAYIAFVMALLDIKKGGQTDFLYRAGQAALVLLAVFAALGLAKPNGSLELARYGVGLFLVYGLTAGIMRARHGNPSARLYLLAIVVFFILGITTITLSQLAGLYTIYVEHVGLLSVAVEVILLALVLAYQFGQVHRGREIALRKLEQSQQMARTDVLTGLANRLALAVDLAGLPKKGGLTFIDLDNLKYYNDHFGHERGDRLLCMFADKLAALLGNESTLYRVGGDEFAVLCPNGDLEFVERMVAEAAAYIQAEGFEHAGASAGSASFQDCSSSSELMQAADQRMYEVKRRRKQSAAPLPLQQGKLFSAESP